jgi:GT2 family glycosyltransferase
MRRAPARPARIVRAVSGTQGRPAEISVVVPSHERPVRLRWLLNALEEQTLAPERWEVVVVHDSGDPTDELLREHPLAARGLLRHVRLAPGTGAPARQRNIGWRTAAAPLVAFTDDDCRPEPDWLERLLEAATGAPGSVVQGATKPDPYEAEIMHWAPRPRSIDVDPPGPHAQTCNILYPRDVLERVDGFDESFPYPAGEDVDLAMRARKAGAGYVGAPDALVYHAVDTFSLVKAVRFNRRWESLALVVKRHPEYRDAFETRIFWKRRHAWLVPALAGALLHRREPLAALLAAPWVLYALPHRGSHPTGRVRAASELFGRALVDGSEMAVLVRGSVRYKTVLL